MSPSTWAISTMCVNMGERSGARETVPLAESIAHPRWNATGRQPQRVDQAGEHSIVVIRIAKAVPYLGSVRSALSRQPATLGTTSGAVANGAAQTSSNARSLPDQAAGRPVPVASARSPLDFHHRTRRSTTRAVLQCRHHERGIRERRLVKPAVRPRPASLPERCPARQVGTGCRERRAAERGKLEL